MTDETTRNVSLDVPPQVSDTRLNSKSDSTVSSHHARRRASIFTGDRRRFSSFRIQAYDCDPELIKWLKQRIKANISSAAAEEKINACFTADESIDFFTVESDRLLVFSANAAGNYALTRTVPAVRESDLGGIYFLKVTSTKVTKDSIHEVVIAVDLPPKSNGPLDNMMLVAKEVYFPLLTNSKNQNASSQAPRGIVPAQALTMTVCARGQEGWPDVISKEVSESVDSFLGSTYTTIGAVAGKTLLPLPYQLDILPSQAQRERAGREKERAHILENSVILWTKQIKAVLKQEPDAAAARGEAGAGTRAQLAFWARKAEGLNSLRGQLRAERIARAVAALEATKSTLHPAFDRLCKDVARAQEEANDNLAFLRPAAKQFELLLTTEFPRLHLQYKPIMHVILLVWHKSRFFNSPARLASLIQGVCNDVIQQARAYMAAGGLWGDPQEVARRLILTIEQCVALKDAYLVYRARSQVECRGNPWRVQLSILFARLDGFVERCHDALDLMQTVAQFSSLSSLEIGGTKGKTLTSSVQQIRLDFQQSIEAFTHSSLDIMDVDCKEFETHFFNFRLRVQELERRLASVIIQAFDDSTTILGRIKLLDSFEGLLLREGLSLALERKVSELLLEYLHDMQRVRDTFLFCIKSFQHGSKAVHAVEAPRADFYKAVQQVAHQFMSSMNDLIPIIRNGPPRAGAIFWIRGLLQRVEDPMHRIRTMGTIRLDTEVFKRVEAAYDVITSLLKESELEFVKEWETEMSLTSETRLRLPLLVKDANMELRVNFDPTVVCMLRETKYFLALGMKVPEAASNIYRNEDTYRIHTANLEMVANMYNTMNKTLLDVERPLIMAHMEQVEQCLQKGMSQMNWKSHSISDFIAQCTLIVTETHDIVNSVKNNRLEIENLILAWSNCAMFKRRSAKTYLPADIVDLQRSHMNERFSVIAGDGESIHNYIANTQRILRANLGSSQFKAYLDFINGMLFNGMVQASVVSCQYLLEQIDPDVLERGNVAPLLEIQLLLDQGRSPPRLSFSPLLALSKVDPDQLSVRTLLLSWTKQMCSIGNLIKRIDSADGDGDYFTEVQEDLQIQCVVSQIFRLLSENEKRCNSFQELCEDYSYLWLDDVEVFYQKFVSAETLPGQKMPPLQSFAMEVNTYRALEDEIRSLAGSTVVGWIKIDIRPFKGSLLALASRWRDRFQQYPVQYVQDTVNETSRFITEAMAGLDLDVIGSDSLYIVFRHLRNIQLNFERFSSALEPLKLTIIMLMKYGIKFSHDVQISVDNACEMWDVLKKKAEAVKARESSFLMSESIALQEKSRKLLERASNYRKQFLSRMPFEFSENFDVAYNAIDQLHHGSQDFGNLLQLLAEKSQLNELQDCFEIEITIFDDITSCLNEMKLLKRIWDVVSVVVMTHNILKFIRWNEMNISASIDAVQELDVLVKKIGVDGIVWPVFINLTTFVLHLQTSLILIKALQTPCMRSRHWKQLMRITGMSFTIDDRFLLGDMLALQLSLHDKVIQELVEKACKEFEIEEKLSQIEKYWSPASVSLEAHFLERDLSIVPGDATFLSVLEEDIILLQLLQNSDLVHETPLFLESVVNWQRVLGAVDEMMFVIFQVQEKMLSLYSAFGCSSEVREQLPEEAMRFDEVLENWKLNISQGGRSPLILTTFGDISKKESFDRMIIDVEKSEEALTYLFEVKQRVCPRFYFLSSDELLQVLTCRSDVGKLVTLCRPCFQHTRTLDLVSEDDNSVCLSARGMYSTADEYVPFNENFGFTAEDSSKAEIWIPLLIRKIQETIQVSIQMTLASCADFSNEIDFECCLQVACTHLRICFTSAVEKIFDAHQHDMQTELREYREIQRETFLAVVDALSSSKHPRMQTERFKLCSILVIKAHNQDVLKQLISETVSNRHGFIWQTHLKFRFSPYNQTSTASIGFHEYVLGNEFIGSCQLPVMTPLTDRCNLSYAQAMHWGFGCLITGPSGVGKTETVKEFGRALSMLMYICAYSSQIDTRNISIIFKGLAQSGAWIFYDRAEVFINLQSLAIICSRFRTILQAKQAKQSEVVIDGDPIALHADSTFTVFMAINSDALIRPDLSPLIKSTFRPCTMFAPNFDLVLEVVLLSHGFVQSTMIAKKLIAFKCNCEDLLSLYQHSIWTLKSIKSIASAAGDLIKTQQECLGSEEQILAHAIASTIKPLLTAEDSIVFQGILYDFFPSFETIPKNKETESGSTQSTFKKLFVDCKLQPNDQLLAKLQQFLDLSHANGSIFVIGPTGSGKTELIRTALKAMAQEPQIVDVINPKAVCISELIGYMDQTEWKDGIVTKLLRSRSKACDCRFILFDGDIDCDWTDSISSLMNDSQDLLIGNGGQISLQQSLHLLFESDSVKYAAPSTVSKGSLLYMPDNGENLLSYLDSWIEHEAVGHDKSFLRNCFSYYFPAALSQTRFVKTIIPLSDLNRLRTTCCILHSFLRDAIDSDHNYLSSGEEEVHRILESLIVFSAIWGVGGSCVERNSALNLFDKIWRESFNRIVFPENETVFDYVFSMENARFVTWKSQMQIYSYIPGQLFNEVYVPTAEFMPLSHLSTLLMQQQLSVMFVGNAGTGKTALMKERMRTIDTYLYMANEICFNFFSDSLSVQNILQRGLVKKSSKILSPPGIKRMVCFIDDMNLPSVDRFGTQQPLALIKQHMNYGVWYDRRDLLQRVVNNVQYFASMNSHVGSFVIDPRLQQSFCTFSFCLLSESSLYHIYSSVLSSHFHTFDKQVHSLATGHLIHALLNVLGACKNLFQAFGEKEHYIFGMRSISDVVQGLCRVSPTFCNDQGSLVALWLHEVDRVFGDILVSAADLRVFQKLKNDICLKWFDEIADIERLTAVPPIFSTLFISSAGTQRPYCRVTDEAKLCKIMEGIVLEYNTMYPSAHLVVFDHVISHICRITRIIDKPCGHCLLVGADGVGKASLVKLSAFACGYKVSSAQVIRNPVEFLQDDFESYLKKIFAKCGIESEHSVLIITSSRVLRESFLIPVNNFLASGDTSALFSQEEENEIIEQIRPFVVGSGRIDTRESCWELFTSNIKTYLHICLCMSQKSDVLKGTFRHLPALWKGTSYSFVFPWSQDALISVANKTFIEHYEMHGLANGAISQHMSFVHSVVNSMFEECRDREGRYNYAPLKTFLNFVDFFSEFMTKRKRKLDSQRVRLERGLERLTNALQSAAQLNIQMISEMQLVDEKSETLNSILLQIQEEKQKAEQEKFAASGDENKAQQVAFDVSRLRKECEENLAATEPIIAEVNAALALIDKKSLAELKSIVSPPPGVEDALAAMTILLNRGHIPKDLTWNTTKKVLSNAEGLMKMLRSFDKARITEPTYSHLLKVYVSKEMFNPEKLKSKSTAAAGISAWVMGLCKYYRMMQDIEPKRQLLAEADEKLAKCNADLFEVRTVMSDIDSRLKKLALQCQISTKEKNEAEKAVEVTKQRIELADRLVNILSEERADWASKIVDIDADEAAVIGDALISSAFSIYAGSFSLKFRKHLIGLWIPDLKERCIHMSPDVLPMDVMADASMISRWRRGGLPSDELCIQNAAILLHARRWPLLIDPHNQCEPWLQTGTLSTLMSVSMSSQGNPGNQANAPVSRFPVKESLSICIGQENWLPSLKTAVSTGSTVVLRFYEESIHESCLDDLLTQMVMKNGKATFVILGDSEIEMDPSFVLILYTQLSNPHFKSKVFSQTVVVNFSITNEGIQERLLQHVIAREMPDLFHKQKLVMANENDLDVRLTEVDFEILSTLGCIEGELLSNATMIEELQQKKADALMLFEDLQRARRSNSAFAKQCSTYRPVSERAVIFFFLIESLWLLNSTYYFSVELFETAFMKGLSSPAVSTDGSSIMMGSKHERVNTEGMEDSDPHLESRINALRDSASLSLFAFAGQSLSKEHKLVFGIELSIRISVHRGMLHPDYVAFILKGRSPDMCVASPLPDWLTDTVWGSVLNLERLNSYKVHPGGYKENVRVFEALSSQMIESTKRFRDWYESERPEETPLPYDRKGLNHWDKLVIIRALRPDRMAQAFALSVETELGAQYVFDNLSPLTAAVSQMSSQVPLLLFPEPGGQQKDTIQSLLNLQHDCTVKLKTLCLGQHNIMDAQKDVHFACESGHWILVQNIQENIPWICNLLEFHMSSKKQIHEDFRLFLALGAVPTLPRAFLKRCIKLVDTGPVGINAAVSNAFSEIRQAKALSSDGKQTNSTDLNAALLSLAMLHAVVIERTGYGKIGWNVQYRFSDIEIIHGAAIVEKVFQSLMDVGIQVSWIDLQLVCGEILYGGHVSDPCDYAVLKSYLEHFFNEEFLRGRAVLPAIKFPDLNRPWNDIQDSFLKNNWQTSLVALGLHPNLRISSSKWLSQLVLREINILYTAGDPSSSADSIHERAIAVLDDIKEKLPSLLEIQSAAQTLHDEKGPCFTAFVSEAYRLSSLLSFLRESLRSMIAAMDCTVQASMQIEEAIHDVLKNIVPKEWRERSYPSLKSLSAWVCDLIERAQQLNSWLRDFSLPRVTWLPGLCFPRAFLAAIMQSAARANNWKLEDVSISVDVTKKEPDEVTIAARDGAYIHGFYLEGARWDQTSKSLEEVRGRLTISLMPVMLVKAAPRNDHMEKHEAYPCPVYRTQSRQAAELIFHADLPSLRLPVAYWTLSSVAMTAEILDDEVFEKRKR